MKANIRMFNWGFFFKILLNYFSYRNVPVREMSAIELAEIENKVQEIERRALTEDIDEDDAGKKKNKNFSIFLIKKILFVFIRRQTSIWIL